MKNLVVTLGITGCGKSRWLKDKSPVIETDDLRIELLDDISDSVTQVLYLVQLPNEYLNYFIRMILFFLVQH